MARKRSTPTDLVFTIEETAQLLKVKPESVAALIRTGDLRAFQVGNEWRVLATDFADFLQRAVTDSSMKILAKSLEDPRTWVRGLTPQEKAVWLTREYPEGSVGDWIKRGIGIEGDEWLKRRLDDLDTGQGKDKENF